MLKINNSTVTYGTFGKLIRSGGFEFILTGVSVFKNKNTISGRINFESSAVCLKDVPPILICYRGEKFSGIIESTTSALFEQLPPTLMLNRWKIIISTAKPIVVSFPQIGIPTNL